MLFAITLSRILSVYIAQGILILFFSFLAYKTLKQSTKRLNVLFSCFYFCVIGGLIFNFFYAPLEDPEMIKPLNFMTNLLLSLAPGFLTLFCLVFYKGEDAFNTSKQILYIVIYAVLLILMIFIPDGVTISSETRYLPYWSLPFFIYVASIIIVFACIPTLIYAQKIYKKFEDELIKKKWKYFIFGTIQLYILLIGTYYMNMILEPLIRLIWSICMFILALSAGYFVYYGYAKKF